MGGDYGRGGNPLLLYDGRHFAARPHTHRLYCQCIGDCAFHTRAWRRGKLAAVGIDVGFPWLGLARLPFVVIPTGERHQPFTKCGYQSGDNTGDHAQHRPLAYGFFGWTFDNLGAGAFFALCALACAIGVCIVVAGFRLFETKPAS